MGEMFIWEEKYETGHEGIDSQHKALFDTANKIAACNDIETIQNYVASLHRYVQEHFDDEEKLMVQSNYPGIHKHHNLHNDLIKALLKYLESDFSEEGELEEFKFFVYEWIINHILYYDLEFIQYYNKQKEQLQQKTIP